MRRKRLLAAAWRHVRGVTSDSRPDGLARHVRCPPPRGMRVLLRRMGCVPLLVLLVAATACATRANYVEYVDSFVGKPAVALYAAWGAPLRSAPVPGGGQVVSFLTNVQADRGFGITACETSFILNAAGVVQQASSQGEGCLR